MSAHSKTSLAAVAAFAGLLLLSGCLELPTTQVMIIIDAEEQPRAQIASLGILVYGSEEGQTPEQTADLEVDAPDFPITLALVPLNDDEGRRFGVEANGLDAEGETIAVVRARGSYVRRVARTAVLRFEESCLGVVDCHPDETCSLGRCLDAQLGDEDYGTLERDGDFALPPYTVADLYTVSNRKPFVFNPTDNDRDPQEEGLALVSGEIVRGTGSVELLPDGDFEFRTNPTYVGEVEVIYIVANPRGMRARGLVKIVVVDGDPGSIDPDLDSDGDGIPDWIEVQGCTDRYNPDTDGDGIPDGVEDRNRNGVVDRYETDPCKADSAGYGLCDGAYRPGLKHSELGCNDFTVVFIDSTREQSEIVDGRTWETAYWDYASAINDLRERDMPIAGRQFWFKAGHYGPLFEGHTIHIDVDGVGIYGGFTGIEEHLIDRPHPFRSPSILPKTIDYIFQAVRISEVKDIVVDGFIIPSSWDGDAGAAIEVQKAKNLDLFHLFIEGDGANGDPNMGDIYLADIEGLYLSDVIVSPSYDAYVVPDYGYLTLRNVGGTLEKLLLLDGEESGGVEPPIHFQTGESLTITKSRFITHTPPLAGEFYDSQLASQTTHFEFSDSIIEEPEPYGQTGGSGLMIRDYRAETAGVVRFSNLSYRFLPGTQSSRLFYYVRYGDDGNLVAPMNLEVSHISASNIDLSTILYLSSSGNQGDVSVSNTVAQLSGDIGPAEVVNIGDATLKVEAHCNVQASADYLNKVSLIPDDSACPNGAALTPPLHERLGVTSLAETSAYYDWRPDTGAPDPGYHARLDGPRILSVVGEPGDAGECAWRIEALGDCYLFSRHSVGEAFIPLPASGRVDAAEGEGLALVCFGDGPPAYARSLYELAEPCSL